MKDIHNENFKSLKKAIKEDMRICKDIPFSWIGRINIVKITILPKVIYNQCNLNQNLHDVLHKNRSGELYSRSQIATKILSQQNSARRVTIPRPVAEL